MLLVVLLCSVVGVVIVVLSVMIVAVGVILCVVCVFRYVLVSVVHPVSILCEQTTVRLTFLYFVYTAQSLTRWTSAWKVQRVRPLLREKLCDKSYCNNSRYKLAGLTWWP